MSLLGICRDSGAVYRGLSTTNGYRVQPGPILLPFRFAQTDESKQITDSFILAEVIFLEFDFDPITRVKRGEVFTRKLQNQPQTWHVQDPIRGDLERVSRGGGGLQFAQLASLITYAGNTLEDVRKDVAGHAKVVLGSGQFATHWKIISIESGIQRLPMLTLKAAYSLGELPEIVESAVPPGIRTILSSELEKVEGSINRLSAVDVVDRCRSALSVVFGELGGDRSRDLSRGIDAYIKSHAGGKDDVRSHAGRIVARLHSRGKPNEQHDKGVRAPTDDDAQLALKCLWTTLVECGWAK